MFLIYTRYSSPRLSYVFQLVFKQLLGFDFEITHDLTVFQNNALPTKFTYTLHPIQKALFFKMTPFLLEKHLVKQSFQIQFYKNLPAFYFHNDERAILPFDPFAMIFYLVSRYEEYIATEKDKYGRFSSPQSMAIQHHFLHQPLVNQWVFKIAGLLEQHFPNLVFKEKKYQFTPTYDIDYAWSYLHKSFLRTVVGYGKSILKGGKDLEERINVQLRKVRDPYFTFDYLDALHKKYDVQPLYFFLVGKFGKYDKNIAIQKIPFQQLIQRIAQRYEIGLHPSYQSNYNFAKLKKEHRDLELVSCNTIEISRQHFLKLEFPKTYQNLLKLGIKIDYSMGYAADVGFRASIAEPFYWFDLSENRPTDLLVVPFQLMDVTLNSYLKQSQEEALATAQTIIKSTKAVNGHLVTLFHNNSFCEKGVWQGWRRVYEQILEMAR